MNTARDKAFINAYPIFQINRPKNIDSTAYLVLQCGSYCIKTFVSIVLLTSMQYGGPKRYENEPKTPIVYVYYVLISVVCT